MEIKKIKLITLLDLSIYIVSLFALMEILSFILFGAVFSWITLLERFPEFSDKISLVFGTIQKATIILIIALFYLLIRRVYILFKKNGISN